LNEIAEKEKSKATWELIQDLITNVINLRAENAVLREKLKASGETASA
jgi:hypothetical protein